MTSATSTIDAVDRPPQPASARDTDLVRALARYRRAVLGVTVALVCVVYVASALTYGRSLRSSSRPVGFNAETADALLHGHLAVMTAPRGLVGLRDPYDPIANEQFRVNGAHDLALYRGKLYTVTGPTAAVLLHVPSRLLGLRNLSPNLATLLGAIGGFVAGVGVFLEVKRRFFPTLPLWAEVVVVLGLGLGSPALWLVSIGRAYETIIACGDMLVLAGAYFLLRGLRDPQRPIAWLLVLASGALASAVGARPHLVAAAVFLVPAALVVVAANRGGGRRAVAAPLACLIVPYLAIGVLLGLYNYERFGSVTEFGTKYQLAGMNMQRYPLYRVGYVAPNVVDYLTLRPRLEASWPFVHLRENTFANDPARHGREPIAGVLWLYPFIAVGLVVTAIRARAMWRERPALLWLLAAGAALTALIVLAISLPFNSSTMRYTVDFTPVLAVVAAVGWAWSFGRHNVGSTARGAVATIWVGAVAVSVLVGLALVLTPCPGTGSC